MDLWRHCNKLYGPAAIRINMKCHTPLLAIIISGPSTMVHEPWGRGTKLTLSPCFCTGCVVRRLYTRWSFEVEMNLKPHPLQEYPSTWWSYIQPSIPISLSSFPLEVLSTLTISLPSSNKSHTWYGVIIP